MKYTPKYQPKYQPKNQAVIAQPFDHIAEYTPPKPKEETK